MSEQEHLKEKSPQRSAKVRRCLLSWRTARSVVLHMEVFWFPNMETLPTPPKKAKKLSFWVFV